MLGMSGCGSRTLREGFSYSYASAHGRHVRLPRRPRHVLKTVPQDRSAELVRYLAVLLRAQRYADHRVDTTTFKHAVHEQDREGAAVGSLARRSLIGISMRSPRRRECDRAEWPLAIQHEARLGFRRRRRASGVERVS